MAKELRILLIEDSDDDAQLLLRELRRAGFLPEVERVQSREEMIGALDRGTHDLIVSDYRLPHFSAPEALKIYRERRLATPFLVCSGSIGEAQAVELLKDGASDFFLKDNLARLGAGVERVLREAENRRALQQATKDLAEREAFLRLVIDQNPNLIFVKDRTGRFTLVNKAVAEAYGSTVEDLVGKRDADFNPNREEVEHFRRHDLAVMDSGREALIPEEALTDARGVKRWLQTVKRPLFGPERRADHLLGVSTDITHLKVAQDAQRESEERLRQLVEVAPNGILATDQNGTIVLVNQRVEHMFGYSREELLGRPVENLLPGTIRAQHVVARRTFMRDPHARRIGVGRELQGQRKDGSIFPSEIGLIHFDSAQGPLVLATIVDVTERRALEGRLQQAQKMEAVGRLAGGIAHDFNNVLGVITGFAELAQRQLAPDHPVQGRLAQIQLAAGRATDLTRQMLAFSRRQVMHPRPLSLNEVAKSTSGMLRRMIGEDVELHLRLEPQLGTVMADPTHMDQVLMNLAVNARDAMPSGGTLTFATANVELDEDYVRLHGAGAPGSYVVLSVSDTGIGMDEETRSHIFEPFFTTKPEGKGTGLGLATVYGIVKQSGGFIWVYSEVEHGATFKIYLPRVDVAPISQKAPEESSEAPGGSETILVVEDQPALLEMIREVLGELGYTVLSAHDGVTAMEVAHRHEAEIRLLLTDVVMPGMNGRQLAERLTSIRPGIQVLYMSGYSDGTVSDHGLLVGDVALIEKPFTPTALAQAVRKILNKR